MAEKIGAASKAHLSQDVCTGSRVSLVGLLSRPDLNGRTGTVVTFDGSKNRWGVRLDDEQDVKSFRRENIVLAFACLIAWHCEKGKSYADLARHAGDLAAISSMNARKAEPKSTQTTGTTNWCA